MEAVLITGGSGLIGTRLTTLLQKEGFEVMHLSRKAKNSDTVKVYQWNISKNLIEEEAVSRADHIINLAGANVAEKRWTKEFKNEILQSRVQGVNTLRQALSRIPNKVKTFISASAIGYYGDRDNELLTENISPASDFLGATCVLWEAAAQSVAKLGIRTTLLRTGIVLSKQGGALEPLMKSIQFGVAPVIGSGKQYYSWIHIDDICRMYIHAISNENISGVYNGVAPTPLSYIDLINAVSDAMGKRKINAPVPLWLLLLLKGDFVKSLISSAKCSSKKNTDTGFVFEFPTLKQALHDLLKK